jgi:hypothetical protein
MLYTSFHHSWGASVIWVYGSDAATIVIGSTGGDSKLDSGFAPLNWNEFIRDIRAARYWTLGYIAWKAAFARECWLGLKWWIGIRKRHSLRGSDCKESGRFALLSRLCHMRISTRTRSWHSCYCLGR